MNNSTPDFDFAEGDPNEVVMRPRSAQPGGLQRAFRDPGRSFGPQAITLDAENVFGRWHAVAVKLSHGICLNYGSVDVRQAYETRMRSQGLLSLSAMSTGRGHLRGRDDLLVSAGQCAIQLLPMGTDVVATVPAAQQVASLRLVVDPERLAQDFCLPGGAERLRQVAGGEQLLDLHLEARRAVQQIIALPLDKPGAAFRIEALTLQFLGAVLDQLMDGEAQAGTLPEALRPRDEAQAHAARQMLALQFDHPPTLTALARRIGSNPGKLSRTFKALFGETLADYALRLRMERARVLLLEERLSVSEVAYSVGYQHHSSFTAAFTSYYGESPTTALAAGTLADGRPATPAQD